MVTNKDLFGMRAKENISFSKDDPRVIMFSLYEALYDLDKLKKIAGKRYDTDYLLYTLAQEDPMCIDNLQKIIDVPSLISYMYKVKNEFKIVKTRNAIEKGIKEKEGLNGGE